jgi:hypothetical protein
MPSLAQSVADLTFTYAERESLWLNRYNKNDQSLAWFYKEAYYQKRIRELLALISNDHLLKCHVIITAKLEKPVGAPTCRRNPEEVHCFIKRFVCPGPDHPGAAPHGAPSRNSTS